MTAAARICRFHPDGIQVYAHRRCARAQIREGLADGWLSKDQARRELLNIREGDPPPNATCDVCEEPLVPHVRRERQPRTRREKRRGERAAAERVEGI